MPEVHNPDFRPQNPEGIGDVRSLLVLIALVLVLSFSFRYIRQSKAHVPIAASHLQTQTAQTQTLTSPSRAGREALTSKGNFGWLSFIAEPLYLTLRFLHDHGIRNWGWSIIVLTVLFNLLIVWPRIMSMKSSLKMMRVQPKVHALKKRYAHLKINDPKRAEMNAEMMDLYRAEGANMFGGCAPLLLQLPLLFAYMSVLRNAAELHRANWLWLKDLSMPDPLHVLPLLIVGSMVLTQWITPSPGIDRSQRWILALVMPAVMGFSLWHYASGLSLYWVTGNIINLMIQLAINRSTLGKEMHALSVARQNKSAPGTPP